jgi:hypothetical protein
MMELIDILEKIFKGTEDDRSNWIQVAKLNSDDVLRKRNLFAKSALARREAEVLIKKAKALKANVEADGDEWWAHLHRTYGLPEGNYHIADDGRILTAPKEEKSDN